MTDKPPFLARAAHWTRVALFAVIAVLIGLIVTTPRNEYPLSMSRAQAATLCAAPGYLMTSLPATGENIFYILDTTKQIIMIYSVNGDALRLVAARKYDYDTDILDGSLVLNNIRVEKGDGISRDEAKIYAELVKAKADELVKKLKP